MKVYPDGSFKILHLFASLVRNPPVSQQKPIFHLTGYAGGQQMKQIMLRSISKSALSISEALSNWVDLDLFVVRGMLK